MSPASTAATGSEAGTWAGAGTRARSVKGWRLGDAVDLVQLAWTRAAQVDVVAAIAGVGNWGVDGDARRRIAWARLGR